MSQLRATRGAAEDCAPRPRRGTVLARSVAHSLGAVVLALGPGCRAPADYAAAADSDVYSLIRERRAVLFGEQGAFSIDPPQDSLRQRIIRGEAVDTETLSLVDALRIAAENSRDYQSRRESLYLTALDLTFERWQLGLIPSAGADAGAAGVGTLGDVADARFDAGVTKILGTGATILSNVGFGLLRTIGRGGDWEPTTSLRLDVTQPLLRGAGKRIVYEPLTRAERELVYEARAFERFRRTFAVDVANRYFTILRQQNRIDNELANYESLQRIRERNEAFARAGRLNEIQVDQARQDEIRSSNRLVVERLSYQNQIDDFKLFLGLPIDASISLDYDELVRLRDADLIEVTYPSSQVVDWGLRARLDYLTALDEIGDAERAVYIAKNALEPGVNFSGQLLALSEPGKPLKFSLDDAAWSLRLELDLPIGNLPERNVYRSTLIGLQQTVRAAEQLGDVITNGLREELRTVQTTLESYRIQANAERLAERRVESARKNQEAGRASTRDVLESQTALLDAQNNTTLALVEHYLAKLALYRDMELLVVDEGGVRVAVEPFEEELEEQG